MGIKLLRAFGRFNRTQWAVLAAFILVLGFTGFYVYRTVERAVYWRSHQDQPLAGWMSVGYIAHSYRVPPPIIYAALGIEPQPRDRRTLMQIAKKQNRSTADAVQDVQTAIIKFRAEQPLPDDGGNH